VIQLVIMVLLSEGVLKVDRGVIRVDYTGFWQR